jgi:hypothetical protein
MPVIEMKDVIQTSGGMTALSHISPGIEKYSVV